LNVSLDLLDKVIQNRGNLTYDDSFIGHRKDGLECQLHCKWLGFQDIDNAWETLTSCFDHNPIMVKIYIKSSPPSDPHRALIATTLDVKQ
jgi:hypothetical protein